MKKDKHGFPAEQFGKLESDGDDGQMCIYDRQVDALSAENGAPVYIATYKRVKVEYLSLETKQVVKKVRPKVIAAKKS